MRSAVWLLLFSIIKEQANLVHSQSITIFWKELHSKTQGARGQPCSYLPQHPWSWLLHCKASSWQPELKRSSPLGLGLSAPGPAPLSSPSTTIRKQAGACSGLLGSETVTSTCTNPPDSPWWKMEPSASCLCLHSPCAKVQLLLIGYKCSDVHR